VRSLRSTASSCPPNHSEVTEAGSTRGLSRHLASRGVHASLVMTTDTGSINIGNTAAMLLCASLVMLMTLGLAFFHGGLAGRKNARSVRLIG
jgi:hypothetical protein